MRRTSEAMPVGINHQFKTICHSQLGKDGCEVVPYRRLADAQALGELLVPQSLTHQCHDLPLSLSERGDFGSFRIKELRRPRPSHFAQDAGDHRRFEPDLTGMHLLDGLQEDLRRFFLADQPHGAQAYRPSVQLWITHPCEDEDAGSA